MEKKFETLLAAYLKNKIGITEDFIDPILLDELKSNLINLRQNDTLQEAGIGINKTYTLNNKVRSDSIYWMDRKNENKSENEFLDQIESFIKYLNKTCYTGITSYEFHYSYYEVGSFYKKHLDQFRNNSGRQYSIISYLNSEWLEADGGQLKIHSGAMEQSISPTQGKTIFFKSNELEHEVLITHQPRMSITGWLKK